MSTPQQLALGVQLRDTSLFSSYYAGSNARAVRTLMDLRAGELPVSVWIWGGAGTGKTHLLQAICAHAGARNETAAYYAMRDFVMRGPDTLTGGGQLRFVCLDDIGTVLGQDDWERGLFRLHTELEESGGRLILASTMAPSTSGIELRDLASRLAAGTLVRIKPLSDDEQKVALQQRAALRGFELPDDTADYLLQRMPRDMATLCAFLDELDTASLAAQRRLTVRFVSGLMKTGISG